MSSRHRDDYEAALRRPKPTTESQLDGLSLFAGPTEGDISALRGKLAAIAGELARKAGRHGCTIGDVRITAENAGLLTGQEARAFVDRLNLGELMSDAGLVKTDRFRRSSVARSNGNIHVVHVLPEFAPVDQRREA